MSLEHPLALLLLALVPGLFVLSQPRRAHGFPGVNLLGKGLEPGFFKAHLRDILAALFGVLLVLAIANPRYATVLEKQARQSRWIMLIQDLSGSMNRPVGPGQTLGDLAIAGARAFVRMRESGDRIGIVAFSGHARLVCPLTVDRAILNQKLFLLRRESDSAIFREMTAGGATNASYAAWLSLSAFFMLLPAENQPDFDAIQQLGRALSGKTQADLKVPPELADIRFGRGMAMVMFTDGRIQVQNQAEDVQAGLPNLANLIRLIRKLGVRFYLIVTGREVDAAVQAAIAGSGRGGRIFFMPEQLDRQMIRQVYGRIHALEKNRILKELVPRHQDTRQGLAAMALAILLLYWGMGELPGFRRI